MKAIILAAGQGTRLRPLTNDRPKCMVEFREKSIIDYIVETMYSANLKNISIVTGYLDNVLKDHLSKYDGISFHHNTNYTTTNMVYSLWCAESEFNDEVVISYSDIIYSQNVLQKLMDSSADISVVIDKNWRELWSLRMEDPLQDAESLILDQDGNILELGKKVSSYDKIQGQYIGLFKFSKRILPKIAEFYKKISCEKNISNMYMTDFLQKLINFGFNVKSVPIHGNWLEIDSISDLNAYDGLKFI
jgi:choline kinase